MVKPTINIAPNIIKSNFIHLCLDILNSSTIISLAPIYINVPTDKDINTQPIHSGKVNNIIPIPIPIGVNKENIKIILIKRGFSVLVLAKLSPNVKDSAHLCPAIAIKREKVDLNDFCKPNAIPSNNP